MKRFAIILSALLSVVSTVFAQEGLKVVTPLFLATDVPEEEVSVITDYFISKYAFSVRGKAEVIDRDSFNMLVEEHNFQSSDWASKEGRSQLEMLNASHLVRGKLSKFRSQLVVTIKLIDVKTGVVYATYEDRIADVEELFDKMPEICEKLAEQIGKSNIKKTYNLGEIGPGGGIIFYIDGEQAYEYSELLPNYAYGHLYMDLTEAKELCSSYKGGGYKDWYLPTKIELNLIYEFFLKNGITSEKSFWSSTLDHIDPTKGNSPYYWVQDFKTGKQFVSFVANSHLTRAIRKFHRTHQSE